MGRPAISAPSTASTRRMSYSVVDLIGYAAVIAIVVALYLAFVVAPEEEVQGIHQKIFYMHVPLALLAYISITVTLVGSVFYLWKRTPRWDHIAWASAEVGVVTTTLTLISGSLWGRPVWGAYWSWSDPRLVTTLVMWLMYIGYLMLRSLGGPGPRIARFAAVLGILGFANVPITYFSVYLWTYLHPLPTLQTGDTPAPFFVPFLVSMLGFVLLYVYLMAQRVRLERDRDELASLRDELQA